MMQLKMLTKYYTWEMIQEEQRAYWQKIGKYLKKSI